VTFLFFFLITKYDFAATYDVVALLFKTKIALECFVLYGGEMHGVKR
jgi:hypothetical protein